MRLPGAEAALLPLHAGDGRGGLRRAAGRVRPGRRDAADAIPAATAPSAFFYAVGWTQHTVGVQYIRTAAIIQLLLGNIGRPGGGILALRGHASIQGSTDIPTLYNLLPGYLPMPKAKNDETATRRREHSTMVGGAKFQVLSSSLMKAWFGEAATAENDWCYDYLPFLTGDHSHMTTSSHGRRQGKGYFVMGENPVVGSMNGRCIERAAQARLAGGARLCAHRDGGLLATPGNRTWRIRDRRHRDRGLLLPGRRPHREGRHVSPIRSACCSGITRPSSRPAIAAANCDFTFISAGGLREAVRHSTDPKDRPIRDLTWDYPVEGPLAEPSAEAVLHEINGFTVADRKPRRRRSARRMTVRPRAAAGSTAASTRTA